MPSRVEWYRLLDASYVAFWLRERSHVDFASFVECGSLAGGENRRPRPDGGQCECDEGWTGINCNGT